MTTNYRVIFATEEGIHTAFETLSTDNFLVAQRILERRYRKMGGILLKCDAWFE